jgi:DivIVA domain-containing protein
MRRFGKRKIQPIAVGCGSALTPEDVHNVAFSKPPIGQRGYNEDEVDQFLDLIEEAMRRRATGTFP